MSGTPLRIFGSEMHVRAGRLALGVVYTARRHTQTVNLYAPLTVTFGLTHGRPLPQVRVGGQLDDPV